MSTLVLNQQDNGIRYNSFIINQKLVWKGNLDSLAFDRDGIKAKLLTLHQPCYVVNIDGQVGATNTGEVITATNQPGYYPLLAMGNPVNLENLGDRNFCLHHGVNFAYSTGAMAGGIASEEMVIALGKAKLLGSFGAGGLSPERLEAAIQRIQAELPNGPYAFNLIHSPNEPIIEQRAVELYLQYGVRTVEASAFLDLTPNIVRYRVAGLVLNSANQIEIQNKVIAKVSRSEVATKFLQPPPVRMLNELVQQGLISEQQAQLAAYVPMADDITVEADSGGHTDNRPLVCLLPTMVALRDKIQSQYNYTNPVRIGVAGGIATPHAALAGLMMGAAYVVTGSVNQSCIESGSCEYTKKLLAQAEMADVMMAPAADMFEMGVKLQVLKRGTLFPMRSQKLYELYRTYNSIEEIPANEREKLEKQVFRKPLNEIWELTVSYLSQRSPEKLAKAVNNPKLKMALIFRWYLGLSSRWSNSGEVGRETDYQIWCGPAMGSFNDWVRDTYLAEYKNRRVVDVANHIMLGAAYLYRVQNLKMQGLQLHDFYTQYYPTASTLEVGG